ncbi:MAG: hypothetical protein HY905_23705 [Deltaproteobacteria bacterium]|nr:hypothetical protein [Deltaproteobacteria bacterium]
MNAEARRPWFRWLLAIATVAAGLPACGGSGNPAGDADVDVDADGIDGDEDIPDGVEEAEEDGGDGEADAEAGDSRTCTSGGECSDHNPCTLDECLGGFCANTAVADGTACDDDVFCMLPGTCESGACTGMSENTCDDSDLCTDDLCEEVLAECRHTLRPRPGEEGPPGDASCSDGLDNDCDTQLDAADPNCVPCTGDAECADANECTDDVCDAGVCRNVLLAEGTACNDGQFCNVDETCVGGVCGGGAPRDCSGVAPVCNVGRCNETEDRCVPEPIVDGTSCSDGLFCTLGETCAGGVCGGGADRDCSMLTDPCNTGACDETAGACVTRPVTDGTTCDDGLFCTTGDHCVVGGCVAGAARSCADADSCTTDSCNESLDGCDNVLAPVPGAERRGTASCSDGLDNDCDRLIDTADPDCAMCGSATDCNDGNPCTTDACTGGICVNNPAPGGSSCDDGQFCTTGDVCTGGACGGSARDCSTAADACNAGLCNETADACQPSPLPTGTVCDADGNPATRDICLAGSCTLSVCGDGFWDAGGTEFCEDGNTLTESCSTPPVSSCVRDCSIRQDTCGDGTLQTDRGESCDDGDTDSFDACTTSCTVNDQGIGAPCTCTGSCPVANPASATISGCSGVVTPTGSLVGCARSGTISGNRLYFAGGFCTAYAHRCRPSWLCGLAGIPADVGNYTAFVGPCPAGSILLQYTVSSSGVTLETKSCQKVCTTDSQCRWNEYDTNWHACGHYECMPSPSTPGTNVCFDSQSSPP